MTKLTRGFTFLFQPALPMRGVTKSKSCFGIVDTISTRTPHAGSDSYSEHVVNMAVISTRTPHAGSD